jgi:hypothetical protein
MDVRLHSIDQLPTGLPPWETILDDLGRPTANRLARALDVAPSTVYRWNAAGIAPRAACLALFWVTRWGRSQIDTRAHNDAQMALGFASSLEQDRDRLRGRLDASEMECEQLARELRQAFARGNAAIAAPIHTGSAPEGASALEWPPLDSQRLVLNGSSLEWPSLTVERPGSREAPPLPGRSEKSRAPKRSRPPRPSDLEGASSSSPLGVTLVSECCHSDTEALSKEDLFYMGQAPAAPAAAALRASGSQAASLQTSESIADRVKAAGLDGAQPAMRVTSTGARVRHRAAGTSLPLAGQVDGAPAACGQLSGPAAQPRPDPDPFATIARALERR